MPNLKKPSYFKTNLIDMHRYIQFLAETKPLTPKPIFNQINSFSLSEWLSTFALEKKKFQ